MVVSLKNMGTLFPDPSPDLKGCKHCGPFRNLDQYQLWMDSDTLVVLLECSVKWCWSMLETNRIGFEERKECELSDNVLSNDDDEDIAMDNELY